jgi:VanZ family protein
MPMRLFAAAAFFLILSALFVGGAQPEAAGLFHGHWDKVAHLAYFGTMAALLFVALNMRTPVLAFVVVAAIGAADELAQVQLPGRHADLPDLVTDVIAAAMVLAAMMVLRRRLMARD